MVKDGDRVDFDESLLSEDSWEKELAANEYEVEKILDVHSGRKTRYFAEYIYTLGVVEAA